MRIDAMSKVSQMYQNNTIKKTSKAEEAKKSDQFQLSQSAKDYKVAKQALNNVEDIREEKVKRIKESMASGTYKMNMEEVAESIVSNYFDSII